MLIFLSSKLATNLFVHPRVAEVRVGKDPRDMFNNDDGHGHYPQAVEAAQVRAGGAGRGGVQGAPGALERPGEGPFCTFNHVSHFSFRQPHRTCLASRNNFFYISAHLVGAVKLFGNTCWSTKTVYPTNVL